MREDEFTARLELLKPRLYRTALLYFGSESKAVDVVDEAVYRAWCRRKQLRAPAAFESWLTRILINVCHDEQRRQSRFRPLEELPEQPVEYYDNLPLKEAVGKLPEQLKEVVILRYFAGYTQEETAKILNLPRTTVLSYQRRALALLRLELGEEVSP
ncbi:MAG: RNA polymerase sigma factor [Candidatus Onthomonas sp.]